MSDVTVIGVVVNPKLKTPVLVTYDDEDLYIWALTRKGAVIGSGSYEEDDESYLEPAHITGMPRVHTPSGVSPKGKGYGTSLYTGLCLGAHQNAENELSITADFEGDGISSGTDSRSASADTWWSRAVQLGLATPVEDEHVQEDVEFDSSDLSGCQSYDGEDVQVSWARGDITKMVRADAYHYSDADSANLIVASFTAEIDLDVLRIIEWGKPKGERQRRESRRYLSPGGLRSVWKKLIEDEDIHEVDADALLALDVRNMDPQAVNLLSTLARWGDADEDDIEAMRMRAELNLDPSVPMKQLRLPFTPNQTEAHMIKEALSETKARRKTLDWQRLSGLP